MDVKTIQGKLNARREELAEIFSKSAQTVDGEVRYDLSAEQLEGVKARNAEIENLTRQLEDAKAVEEIHQTNTRAMKDSARHEVLSFGKPAEGKKQVKTLGDLFVESAEYRGARSKKSIHARFDDFDWMEAKTLMQTSAGFAPQAVRTGVVVPFALRRPVVADLMPNTSFDQSAAVYMEETTLTNAAAPRLEGGAAGESALAFTERTAPVREIATWLPVTEIQLEDVAMVRSLINNRLLTMLALKEESEMLTGDGNAPNLTGFLVNTSVQSQAKGTDPVPDAIFKAITKVRFTGFAEPTAVVIHPNDWEPVRLLRTVDGIYIWGNPSEAGPERIFGLPVVVTPAITENTALLGDFQMFAEVFRRRGANVKVSDSHSDYFVNGKVAIRADERVSLAIYRPTAFCKVTGI